jgi:RNA polymerase sigma factor (sigma-70 family)
LRGYLFRIAANLSVDRVRQRFVREKAAESLFDELAATEALEHQAITREEFDCACNALNELSPNHREAFVRHVVEGFSTPEVAIQMNVDERTVRKYVTRALLHCRRRLQGE